MEDKDLILAYFNGDQEAFKKIVEKYTPPLYNFLRRLTGEEASDLVQETFIKAWKNLKKFNPEKASFKTWIFTIAKNSSTDFFRKKKSLNFSDLNTNEDDVAFEETIVDEDILPDEAMQKLQDADFLSKILDTLSLQAKTVLTLHLQEEMTFEEIGKLLKKPLNTVKSQYRRALIELRKKI